MSRRTEYYNDLFKRAHELVVKHCGKHKVPLRAASRALNSMRKGKFTISANSAFTIYEALNDCKRDGGLDMIYQTCRFIFTVKGEIKQAELALKSFVGSKEEW